MSVDWKIEVYSSGNTWIVDGYIQRPNEDLETNITSTVAKSKLADGSYCRITPETKKVKESFTMFFANTTEEFREQIEDYMVNGDKVRITTHTGEVFIGKFLDMKRTWFSGMLDAYDVTVTFDQIED
jgi:hypothetical protein